MDKTVLNSPVLMTIFNRRSRRRYTSTDISQNLIDILLDAAHWAPSGLNNQPWRFSIIKNENIRYKLSQLTKYSRIVQTCNTCIAVFYHLPSGYNRDKDIMSIGASIQNMLLAAETLKIGSVWLGEILNKNDVNRILEIDDNHELMALIALGYSEETPEKNRKELKELTLKSFL